MILHKAPLKSLGAQGQPKESWEVCKVHAGIVVQSRMNEPQDGGPTPHGTVATSTGGRKVERCMAAGGRGEAEEAASW